MIPPHRHRQQEDNVDSWLMSYADMITLLLCFFIIFVSVSEPKNDKFSAITQGLANRFGSVDMSTPLQGTFQSLEAVVEAHKMFKDVSIEKSEHAIQMELSSGAFFKPDSIELDEQQLPLLTEMVAAIKKIDYLDYRVVVEVYGNDVPVHTSLYPTSWELSSVRAAKMVRFFIEQGIEAERMKAVGYGDTHAKVPNLDMQGNPIPENREKNQRIAIKIERVLQ